MRLSSTWMPGAFLVAVALVASPAAPAGSGAASPSTTFGSVRLAMSAVSGNVRIDVRLRSVTRGTFALTGAVEDEGAVRTSRRVAGGRLLLTETLVGREGTIRVRAVRTCSGRSGTWRVLSGTEGYRGLGGGGTTSGGPVCESGRYPTRLVHTGTVRTPEPPPLAQPGQFGGGTAQHVEVFLTVDPGGRTFSGLRFSVNAPCTGPHPLSTNRAFVLVRDPQPIGEDGRFSLPAPTGWTGTITGRFVSPTRVEGTASMSRQTTSEAGTFTCSATVTWMASMPPPTAPPGTYCGFTLQGPGVCFDVAASGREVTRFESAVVARCFPGGAPPTEFEIGLVFTGSVPLGGHLGFSKSGLAVEGLVSGAAGFSGVVDPAGTASGGVSLASAVLDHEGTRYRCLFASGRWEAKRQ